MTIHRDPARSYAPIDDSDLERLRRAADAEIERFFARNPHLAEWRRRAVVVALAQGGAEHRLRGRRGVRDLDVIVCFSSHESRSLRRPVTSWDWGPSKFGRCPHDPPEYTGRAVDMKLWVIPERTDPVEGLREWLAARLSRYPDALRKPDVAQEPVILIRPRLGEIAWDPGPSRLLEGKVKAHRRPVGVCPP